MSTAACVATMATVTVLSLPLLTWRCAGCSRIICRLEWAGARIEQICKCKARNTLPDDAHRLRREGHRT